MKITCVLPVLVFLAGCGALKGSGDNGSVGGQNQAVLEAKALTAGSIAKLLADEPLDESDKKNAAEAVPIVKRLIENEPNQPAYVVLLGRCYWVMGKTDDARAEIEKAIALNDKYQTGDKALISEAHHDLAMLDFDSGNFKGAQAQADQALALFPDDPRYLMTRARVLLQQGDFDGARKVASEVLRVDPQNSAALSMIKMIQAAETKPSAKPSKNPDARAGS